MKSIKDNWIYLSLLLFLFTFFYTKFFYISFIACLFLWFIKTKDTSWIFISIFFLLIAIPKCNLACPSIQEAKAIKVKGSYSVLVSNNTKMIVYTDVPLQIDATYTIHGTFNEIESSTHFYGLNNTEWCQKQGIYYSINEEDITLKNTNFSFRHYLQSKIQSISNTNTKQILYKTLLNINLKDTDDSSWFYSNGFSYAGVLSIIDFLLKKFIDKKDRKKILIVINIVLMIIYRFPLLLVSSFLFRLFSFTNMKYKRYSGFIISLLILLYPQEITSITFLLPVIYRYSFLFKDASGPLFISFCIQSLLFQSINPIKSLLYRYFMKIYGLLYLLGFLELFTSIDLLKYIDSLCTYLFQLIDVFNINGSIFGIGFIIFCLIIFFIHKQKYFYPKCIGLLFLFLLTGLFHPCSELTVINVGQGDSIFIRGAFNSTNILVDTGKESAYSSLKSFLNGKGINRLDALIITHPDEDHNGNLDNLKNDYNIQETITEHIASYKIGDYEFTDLNTINNEDTNESSIVNTFTFHDSQVCLMGDSDQFTEETIIKDNPSLSCDILKVSHHGSKTGSSDEFLDTVKPEVALISSGPYYIYHHPSEEVIQKLLKRHIPYLDTKEYGDITIVSLFGFNVLITSNWCVSLL